MSPTMIVSWAAVAIAAVALGFSIWQGIEQRRHNRLSVKPTLAYYVTSGEPDGRAAGVYITNVGAGPAFPVRTRVVFDGAPLRPHPFGPFGALGSILADGSSDLLPGPAIQSSCSSDLSALRPGDAVPLMVVHETPLSEEQIDRLEMMY